MFIDRRWNGHLRRARARERKNQKMKNKLPVGEWIQDEELEFPVAQITDVKHPSHKVEVLHAFLCIGVVLLHVQQLRNIP